jgi:glucose/arabinose dehydrogenase
MKRFIKIGLLVMFACSILLFFSSIYRKNNMPILEGNHNWKVVNKGIAGARDFTFDNKGSTYIALNNKVQAIDNRGRSYEVFYDNTLNINAIVYKDEKLYYISDSNFACYDLKQKVHNIIVKDIPNFGDYKNSKLMLKDNNIFITIGAATNSGIVGEDNKWLDKNPFGYDLSPKLLTVNGKVTAQYRTGAFVPYNTKNINGQLIPAHFPGNASVMVYNIESKDAWLYAWGIRNVGGIDFNSEGKIFTTVGGFEDRGLRTVKGDVDYIYELKENVWYGWPDYSGGDPISSPRFKGANNERLSFILEKHPTTNPPAPVYQHRSIASLQSLFIDRHGSFGEKDSIYFHDIKDNILYKMNSSGLVKEYISFKGDVNITSIKVHDNNIYMLDSHGGYLICAGNINNITLISNRVIIYYLLVLIVIFAGCIMWKVKM